MAGHDEAMNPATNGARKILDIWQAEKTRGTQNTGDRLDHHSK
jgi:hypothetical protein